MYENATVITLTPKTATSAPSRVEGASFEEAFGEYSNANGKRRKKRQARKLEKIGMRKERRSARQDARKSRKLGRVEARDEVRSARQEARQTRRASRGERRLGRRADEMEQRQNIRTRRKELRLGRRELGREEEPEILDTPTTAPIERPTPSDQYYDEPQGGGYADDQAPAGSGYSEPDQTGGGTSSAPTGGGYADEQAGSDYGYEEEGDDYGYEEEGDDYGYEEEGDAGNYNDSEEMGDYEEEGDEYDYSEPFDGIQQDDTFSEMDDSGTKSKSVKVNPKLQDVANKIEWNKQLIELLEQKRRSGVSNPSEISRKIIERRKRLGELESALAMYEGFSGADGMSQREVVAETKKRRQEIAKAKGVARAIRNAANKGLAVAAATQKQIARKMTGKHGGDTTPVDVELKAEFDTQRIVIPASEKSSSATGIIGLDDANDYDSHELDIMLGADGYTPEDDFLYAEGPKQANINWTGVILGLGLGALAIYGLKKAKVF